MVSGFIIIFERSVQIGDVIQLDLPTFTATAEMAGRSRLLGGYHIQSDNIEGLRLGKKIADATWSRYQEWFGR